MRHKHWLTVTLILTIGLAAAVAPGSYQFKQVTSAPNEPDVFLWGTVDNWIRNDFTRTSRDLPSARADDPGNNDKVYIGHEAGGDESFAPVHCTVRTEGLDCAEIRIGYNRRSTEASSLTIEKGSLTSLG